MDSSISKSLLSRNTDYSNLYFKRLNENNKFYSIAARTIFHIICFLLNVILIIFIFRRFLWSSQTNNNNNKIAVVNISTSSLIVTSKVLHKTQIREWELKMNYNKFYGYDFENATKIQKIIKCNNRKYKSEILMHGNYWVLKNYIKADFHELNCYGTITYTTHADYTFLDNVIPLLKRWKAPLSVALYAPGTDYLQTIYSIHYLRNCLPDSSLVRKYTTFHIYFGYKNIPDYIHDLEDVLNIKIPTYNCTWPAPYINVNTSELFKTKNNLLYPINVGRNIAREAALTYFILASDIELYPSLKLPQKFFEMILREKINFNTRKVFPLPTFEVKKKIIIPKSKTELIRLLKTRNANRFHLYICPTCHIIPHADEWEAANETNELKVFEVTKRRLNWEPIYIGTHFEPYYDERLSWEGKSDKMTQGYVMCLLDYEFHILDNAFLVHKAGIKTGEMTDERRAQEVVTQNLISERVLKELQTLYGSRSDCEL